MRRALNRHAGPLALAALIVSLVGAGIAGAGAAGVFVTGKQIKNGSITARDLHRNSVRSSAIGNGAVKSADVGAEAIRSADIGTGQVQDVDIGDDQVTPRSLSLPAPMQFIVPPQVVGPVGPDFGPLASVGVYSKASASSVVKVDWSGVAVSGEATNCIFQIRVNGAPPEGGGGEVFAFSTENVSTSAVFSGQPAGPVEVEVWSKYSGKAGGQATCILSPDYPGLKSTFVISEDFT